MQLSLESSVSVNPDEASRHLSTRAAQNDLSTFFRAVPTTAVNAFHDPSKPPHYYSSPSHTHQKLSDTKAQRELDDYFTSLPAHNVNAYHDNSAQHATANGLSTSKADTELSKYYDAVPAHLVKADHEPNKGQGRNHLSLRQGVASAPKRASNKGVDSSVKSAAPVKKAAPAPVAVKQGRRMDHKPYHDTKIAIIQDWGPDADAPTVGLLEQFIRTRVNGLFSSCAMLQIIFCFQVLFLLFADHVDKHHLRHIFADLAKQP